MTRSRSPSALVIDSQPHAVLGQVGEVVVGGIGLLGDHDGALVDEARQIVDVPVGVVAGDAVAEPQHLAHAQVLAEHALQLLARDAGVARLDRAQQALLGGQQRPAAVDVDAAPLEDDPARARVRRPASAARRRRRSRRASQLADGVVALVVGVLRPAVELPVGQRDLTGVAVRSRLHEQRAEVARPAAIGRDAKEVDLRPGRRRPAPAARAPSARSRRPSPGCAPARPAPGGARPRRRPTGSGPACRASRPRSCGQASQVAACGSHSAGMR